MARWSESDEAYWRWSKLPVTKWTDKRLLKLALSVMRGNHNQVMGWNLMMGRTPVDEVRLDELDAELQRRGFQSLADLRVEWRAWSKAVSAFFDGKGPEPPEPSWYRVLPPLR